MDIKHLYVLNPQQFTEEVHLLSIEPDEAQTLIGAILPDQTGHTGQFLQTDGTNLSWQSTGGGGFITSVANTSAINLSVIGGQLTASFSSLLISQFTNDSGYITSAGVPSLPLSGANGGTGVANTGFTITLAGNLVTTGAFNTTFAQQFTGILTLPPSASTLAASTSALTSGRIPYITTNGLLIDTANILWDNSNLILSVGDLSAASKNLSLIVSNSSDIFSLGDNTAGSEKGIFYYGATSSGFTGTEKGVIIDLLNNQYVLGDLAGTSVIIDPTGNFIDFSAQVNTVSNFNISAANFVFDTVTGVQIGTAINQKLAFYNSTPIVQPNATTDLGVVLSNLGLRAVGTAYPISTSGTITLTNNNIVLSTVTGTKFGTATNQKLAFYNSTPVIKQTTSVATSTFVANTSGIVDDSATFGGYKISQVVKALQVYGLLA